MAKPTQLDILTNMMKSTDRGNNINQSILNQVSSFNKKVDLISINISKINAMNRSLKSIEGQSFTQTNLLSSLNALQIQNNTFTKQLLDSQKVKNTKPSQSVLISFELKNFKSEPIKVENGKIADIINENIKPILLVYKGFENLDVEKSTKTLETITGSITKFSSALLVATPVIKTMSVLAPLYVNSLQKIVNQYVELGEKEKEIKKGSKILTSISLSMGIFVGSSLLIGAAIIQNPIEIAAGVATIFITAKMFSYIGDESNSIMKGGSALAIASLAILGFSYTLKEFQDVNFGTVLQTLTAVSITSLAFNLIGQFSSNIIKGSISVGIMSLSILGFNYVLKQFEDVEYSDVLHTLGAVGLSALAFSLVGKLSTQIILGSVAVGVMSLSLYGLSYVINEYKDMEISLSNIGMIAAGIGILGATFAAAGTVTGLMISGSIGVGAIALSLYGLGKSLETVLPISENITLNATAKLAGFLTSMGLTFAAIGNPITLPFILSGSAATASIGFALDTLSNGVKTINNTDLSNLNEEKVNKLKYTITGLADAFAIAGGEEPKNVLSFLTGATLGPTQVERGIRSVLMADEALKAISTGLKQFQKDTSGLDLRFDPNKTLGQIMAEGGELSLPYRISAVVGMINQVFSAIGSDNNSDGSLVKSIFGSDFSQTNTERGIQAVKDSGETLKNLADGLKAFKSLDKLGFTQQDFVFNGVNETGMIKPVGVASNIASVLTMVNRIFGEIGKNSVAQDSIFSLVFGSDFSQTNVEKGIDSVRGSGEILKNLADGLKAFKSLDKLGLKPEDFQIKGDISSGKFPTGTLLSNIASVLNMVKVVFSEIGKTENGGTSSLLGAIIGTDFSRTDVEKGVDSVRGIGEELKGISTFLTAFSDLTKPTTITYTDKDGKKITEKIPAVNLNTISSNISKLLTSVFNVFAEIGTNDKYDDLEDGVERANMIAPALESLSGSVLNMSKAIVKSGVNNESKTPIALLTSDLDSFFTLLDTKLKDGETLKTFGLLNTKISQLSNLSTNFKTFTDNFKVFTKSVGDLFTTLNDKVNDKTKSALDVVTNSFIETSKIADGFKIFSVSYSEYQKSFGKYIDTINNQEDITWQKYDKITKSFSDLSDFNMDVGIFTDFNTQFENFVNNINNIEDESIAMLNKWIETVKEILELNGEAIKENSELIRNVANINNNQVKKSRPIQPNEIITKSDSVTAIDIQPLIESIENVNDTIYDMKNMIQRGIKIKNTVKVTNESE